MTILSTDGTSNAYNVLRGALGSIPTTHNAGDAVLHLDSTVVILPFAANFFANRASVNFLHTFSLPDVRVSAAELFVTNAFGDSQTQQQCYTNTSERGLRTLSGGQFSLQASGYLATQLNAAPPLLVEASHAVRDIRANVSQAPSGYNLSIAVLQNNVAYCNLTINTDTAISTVIDGTSLPALIEGSTISMNITLDVVPNYSGSISPGRDLTVTIRL